ncbi:hypothetical protein ACOMHN_039803 [Nucella lapillus]
MLSLTGAPSPDHNAPDGDAVSPPVPAVSEADTSVSPTGPADNSTVMPLEETQHTTPTSGCLTVADCEQSQDKTQQQITPTHGSLQHPTPTPGSMQHPTPMPGGLQQITPTPGGLQQITTTPGGLQQPSLTPGCPTVGAERNDGSSTSLVDSEPHTSPATADQPTDTPSCPDHVGAERNDGSSTSLVDSEPHTSPATADQPTDTPSCPDHDTPSCPDHVGAERNDGSSTSLVDSEPHTSPATADQPTDTPSCPDHGEVSNQPPVQPPLVTSAPTSDSYTTKTTEASSDDTSTADSDMPTGQSHDIDNTCTKGTESFPHCQNSHFCPSAKKRIETLLKSQ